MGRAIVLEPWVARTAFAHELGCSIRELRKAAKLTQATLGSPLTRSYISAVEHGRIVPSLPVLMLLAERLQVPPESLLPGDRA